MLSALIAGELDLVLGDGLALWNFLNTPSGRRFHLGRQSHLCG